jgi:lipopolysaccharide/colanic/teichoic acid biosynthesis glycosyltransferase
LTTDRRPPDAPPGPAKSGLPRPVEAVLAAVGLVVTAPLIALGAGGVALTSPGPLFFVQQRVGREGRRFRLWKLRTMRADGRGPLVTARHDARITPWGRVLRRTKVDELPQLWNVLRGEMSFVGPRPEVPDYVDLQDDLWQRVLRVRPGITDPVTLRLIDEEALLSSVRGDRERYYRETLLPKKLRAYANYLASRSAGSDLKVLLQTALAVVGLRRRPSPALESDRFDTAEALQGRQRLNDV